MFNEQWFIEQKTNVIGLLKNPLEKLLEKNIEHKVIVGIFKHLIFLYFILSQLFHQYTSI